MNLKTSAEPFTYDDYLALPDDGKRYEVIEGELSMTPAPSPRHQKIQLRLGSILLAFVDKHSLGEVYVSPIDVALSLIDIVQPDILFIAKDRKHIIAKRNIVGIPNLIVEILSPTTTARDRVDKLALYQRYALPEYWIVDSEGDNVETYVYQASQLERTNSLRLDEQLHSRQIVGFSLKVAEIFS
jgi:Uma2 family endonuclease